MVLRWAISREAAAAAPGLGAPEVVLELGVDGQGRIAGAGIVDGRTRRKVPASGRGAWEKEGDLWHLNIPGLVAATLRTTPRGIVAIYARTVLLARLGIQGGRYEFAGCAARD